jgi:hypothetical protein
MSCPNQRAQPERCVSRSRAGGRSAAPPWPAVIIEPRKGPAATDAALARGEGAPVCKGRLVDIASIEQAEMIVRQAKMIAR